MMVYQQLQQIFDLFNESLFLDVLGDKVSPCIFTLQRKKNVFSENLLNSMVRIKDDGYQHEIILNPQYFGIRPRIELLQAIAHQMMHLYQFEHGSPQKLGAHDEQYQDFMSAIGLMPSSTGLPDGKPTGGKKMFNYPMAGGVFLKVAEEALNENLLPDWFDVSCLKDTCVDSLIKDMYGLHELLEHEVDPRLLEVPLLVKMNIDVQALLSCLSFDEGANKVVVDHIKAHDIAETAIQDSQSSALGERQQKPLYDPSSMSPKRVEPTVSPYSDECAGDAADKFLAAHEGKSKSVGENPDGDGDGEYDVSDIDSNSNVGKNKKSGICDTRDSQESNNSHIIIPVDSPVPVVVSSADQIASILGVESAEAKKPAEKKKSKYKYECSCGKILWAGLDLNAICGACGLKFRCEAISFESNVVDADY